MGDSDAEKEAMADIDAVGDSSGGVATSEKADKACLTRIEVTTTSLMVGVIAQMQLMIRSPERLQKRSQMQKSFVCYAMSNQDARTSCMGHAAQQM